MPQHSRNLIPLLVLASFAALSVSSEIHIFRDAQCTQTQNNITGPNGYPDGSCTLFSQWASGNNYSSFQVGDLDPGCTVAIYGDDINTFICSSKVFEIAEVGKCYNASWVYYSIDGCISPGETPSAVPSGGQSSPTGAIVGGVVGGVVAVAAVIGAFLYARRSWKLQSEHREHNAQLRQDLYELASKRHPAELVEKRSPVEMEADSGFGVVPVKPYSVPSGERGEEMVVSNKDRDRREE
ncbi:uncharacterized protein BKCO1_37000195 [Diplodia corticola]|uniref:Uncharacterized protein n=1 Tax=Diplodia corticola TaxID=236234 RepID=A0A1J9QVQ6_9PEZI|nr:uncharacterized protein BKCO1_37000195 [Diplodia corticola]OJD32496.1 hypothetical protein BKCO1_37000195 [Diplodia corticola]